MISNKFLMSVFISVLLSGVCLAQQKKGHAYIGTGILVGKEISNKVNMNAGVGFSIGNYLSAGLAFDLYIFKDPKFVIPKADFRIYPMSNVKEVSPFVALQPGYVLYNQKNVKGAASIDLLAGIMARPVEKKGIGVALAVGYSKFGFKHTSSSAIYTDAFKIQAGILF